MNYKIALIKGDGIGPEVVGEAVGVLEAVGKRFGHTSGETVCGNVRTAVWAAEWPFERLSERSFNGCLSCASCSGSGIRKNSVQKASPAF